MLNFLKMKPFQLVTMALLNGFFGSLAFAQDQDLLSIEQVKNGLYIIIGSGGNVGVRVTDEGVISKNLYMSKFNLLTENQDNKALKKLFQFIAKSILETAKIANKIEGLLLSDENGALISL